MIRVMLADDHAIVRDGLRMVLEAEGDFVVVGEAENGAQTLKLLPQLKPDVLLLDISMPGLTGFDVVQRLNQKAEQTPVLILSMYPEEQYALRFFKAGAAGYVAKDAASTRLVDAVRVVASGRKYISPEVATLLAETLSGELDQAPHELLSDREYQVMCQIGSGKTVSQIAEQMSLSVRTISTYRARILAKMRMGTNAELTHYTIKHGLA